MRRRALVHRRSSSRWWGFHVGYLLEMEEMLFQHFQETLSGEWFRQDIIHPYMQLSDETIFVTQLARLTVLKVHLNVVATNVRSHCDNGCPVELTYKVTCGYTVEIWHDYIHQDEIVFHTLLHLVDGFQTIQLPAN